MSQSYGASEYGSAWAPLISLLIQHCEAVSFYEMSANVQQQMTVAAKKVNMTRQRHMSANKLRWLIVFWNSSCLSSQSLCHQFLNVSWNTQLALINVRNIVRLQGSEDLLLK